MQEDQMWAMQDYIQQYQQLVCRFRSENASLRRQLNEERGGAVMVPQPTPSLQPSPPPYRSTPPAQPASPPKTQVPNPNMETPDVPPLQRGAANELNNWNQSFANRESGATESDRYAQLASYDAPASGAVAPTGPSVYSPGPMNSLRQTGSDSVTRDLPTKSPDVLVSGEVVANEGGGPRLAIDVERFDQTGKAVRFDGTASLAIVNLENGVQQRLARWDFGPNEVRATVDSDANEPTMHFRVELPPETKIDGKNQLWVRLVPSSGASLLSHARLDLSKPGLFSSRTDKVWNSEESSVVAASYEEPSTEASQTDDAPPDMNEGKWVTAAPGKPANLPAETDQAAGGWRAASGPIPVAVVSSTPAVKTWDDRPKQTEQAVPKVIPPAPVEVSRKPTWMPDRPGTSPRVSRPSWSATR
jgi:hypothetical protein